MNKYTKLLTSGASLWDTSLESESLSSNDAETMRKVNKITDKNTTKYLNIAFVCFNVIEWLLTKFSIVFP